MWDTQNDILEKYINIYSTVKVMDHMLSSYLRWKAVRTAVNILPRCNYFSICPKKIVELQFAKYYQ